MLHTFKVGGQRIAYDSVSGYVLPLSELAYKMLDYLVFPMPKECSSELRYDLAKFDSRDIEKTYKELYALYSEGKLFRDDTSDRSNAGGARIKLGDTVFDRVNSELCDIAKEKFENGEDITVCIEPASELDHGIRREDLPIVKKELDHLARLQIKMNRNSLDFKPFVNSVNKESNFHDNEICRDCWALKMCTLKAPAGALCELECKRIECVMATSAVK